MAGLDVFSSLGHLSYYIKRRGRSKVFEEILTELFEEMTREGEKWEEPHCEDDEALSLCDLPVNENNGGDEENVEEETRCLELEEFEFGSWGGGRRGGGGNGSGSVLAESEMCAADDVFFQGQLLPLRLSSSSENGLPMTRQVSRSESMYHSSSSASSSRSQSHRHSSTTATTTTYKPKLRNNFHSHPSPKPQVWVSGSRSGKSTRTRKSSVWGLFRVGLVRTPEIELEELKRSFNTRSSSNGSGSGSSSCSNGRKSESGVKSDKKKNMTQRFLFESCKCSVDAVDIVPQKKIVDAKNVKKVNHDEEGKEEKEKKQKKQALHQRRTVEWLKELSITGLSIEV